MTCGNTIPRPEFPNPQFERENWLNLNGEWMFEMDPGCSGAQRKLIETDRLSGSIMVPFCPESRLSGIGNTDFMNGVWYKRSVNIEKNQLDGRVFLHFGAVDYEAKVYVNGRFAFSHKGGYTHFCGEITHQLRAGENLITVAVLDETRSPLVPRGKQSEQFRSHGCDYTRTTGIWQTVWLEFVPLEYIESFRFYPEPDSAAVSVSVSVRGEGTLRAEAYYDGEKAGEYEGFARNGSVNFTVPLSETHLWEPGEGRLYDVALCFGRDTVKSYFGLRKVCLEGMKFLLNGKSVFQRLVLDQGFYPDGIYTAPDDAALAADISLSMAAGFNGARLHQKVFEPRFLYHCDKAGYMVWGEYPNWGLDHSDPRALTAVLPEWCEALERDFNHPSIIGWCPFNETSEYRQRGQNDELLRIVYKTTKQIDKTRPCIDTSGYTHVVTDIYDVHDYDQDPVAFRERYRVLAEDGNLIDVFNSHGRLSQCYNSEPVMISEYGGIQWSVGDSKGWGYGNAPKSVEEFIARYRGLTDAILDNAALLGFCYTQLYDIEQEQNGLYTYDRHPKFDMEIFHTINSRKAAIE